MLTHFRHLQLFRRVNRITINNFNSFAKGVKKDAGKKDDKGAAAAPFEEEPKMEQLILKWIQPTPLSPPRKHNISMKDSMIFWSLIKKYWTGSHKKFWSYRQRVNGRNKKGGLGTTDMYYTAVEPLPQGDLSTVIKQLRK